LFQTEQFHDILYVQINTADFIKNGIQIVLYCVKIDKNFIDLDRVENLALEAFPPEEYLSPVKILEMSNLDFFAIYDGDKFIGFMVVKIYKTMSYLFFLAVDRNFRGQGYGSEIIQKIKELYPDYNQVVDFEMIDKNASNYNQRVKRKEFYMKNGYKETGYFLSYLGVNYEIMSMDDNFDIDIFKELISTIKIKGFEPKYYN